MVLGKREELDNKFLLVVILIVAVIFLSNNGFFTGKAARYLNPLEVREAQGDVGVGIVSQQPTSDGSGGQFAMSDSCQGGCYAYNTNNMWIPPPGNGWSGPGSAPPIIDPPITRGGLIGPGGFYYKSCNSKCGCDFIPASGINYYNLCAKCGNNIVEYPEECDPPYNPCNDGINICLGKCICTRTKVPNPTGGSYQTYPTSQAYPNY